MRFCHVVLLLTLGMNAELVLQAQAMAADQALPGGSFLVASEALPQGALFLPQLLASGHNSLLKGLPLNPEISQSMPEPPAAPTPKLTRQDRVTLFWNETYASPGIFAGLSAGALIDQARHTPAKWDADGSAYTRRFGSEYGQLVTRNVIHQGLAALTGLDPRYPVCKCDGVLHRSAHALKMSFTTYRQDGRLTLDVPQIAGAYGAGMVSTYWFPHHQYSPLVQGVQFGHEQMGEVLAGNLVQEFGPSIERALHVHSWTARRPSRLSDDD